MNNLYVANSGGGFTAGNIVKITDATGASPTPSVFIKAGAEGLTFPHRRAVRNERLPDRHRFWRQRRHRVRPHRTLRSERPDLDAARRLDALAVPVRYRIDQFRPSVLIANLGAELSAAPCWARSRVRAPAVPGRVGKLQPVRGHQSGRFGVHPSDSGFSPSALVLNAGTRAPVVNPGTGYTISGGRVR